MKKEESEKIIAWGLENHEITEEEAENPSDLLLDALGLLRDLRNGTAVCTHHDQDGKTKRG